MRTRGHALLLGLVIFLGVLGCGVTDTIVSNVVGGSKGSTVGSLWPDVPVIQGGQRLSLDMPLPMQLAIQGLIKASASGSDVNLDRFDWIAFSTSQTPEQVAAFYSVDRMSAAGWSSDKQLGCTSGSDTSGIGGAFCVFTRGKTGEKQTVLFIVLAQDNQSKQTQLFYVRLEGIVTATPTRSR